MSSLFRRAGADLLRLLRLALDPAAAANEVQMYPMDVNGIAQLFARASDGTIYQLTAAATSGSEWFGSGIDGNLNFDGAATVTGFAGLSLAPVATVYTLTRDIFANNLTLAVGATIKNNGYRIFVSNALALGGLIHNNGGNGGNSAGNAAGAAGAAGLGALLWRGLAGGAGGAVTAAGVAGVGGTAAWYGAQAGATAAGANGGLFAGGGGGANDIGTAGATVAALVVGNQLVNSHHTQDLLQAICARTINNADVDMTPSSGGGGRGGSISGGGGGGGGSAGSIVVSARTITGAGSITANGGNGGNGNLGGGGGGGGGGALLMLITTSSTLPTTSASGGAAGAAGATVGAQPGGTGGNGQVVTYRLVGL